METKRQGFGFDNKDLKDISDKDLNHHLITATPERLFYVKYAIEKGMTLDKIYDLSKIDKWFLHQMKQIVDFSKEIDITEPSLRKAKEMGFSDFQLSNILNMPLNEVRNKRKELNIIPTFKLVDTCAAEFEAHTPYYYSTYETENENKPSDKRKVMILGGGPNRIGQGIEFDYCCVHASMAAREENVESIMVNSNPETVSTDFDISDKLFFEPLTYEDVMNIYEAEKPDGVIVQFGGQTPLNIAKQLEESGAKILGTSTENIDRAEDREKFQSILQKLNLKQPENGIALNETDALQIANRIEYPVLVRPSYVLGGASMKIVYNDDELKKYIKNAINISPEHPILIDKYLEEAIEVDIDALSDGNDCLIAGILEHIEEAGIHSGDSACVIPPYTLNNDIIEQIEIATKKLAKELNVIGLMNIQFAVKNDTLYIIEVNPRGSRTVPFVSKATGISWAKLATKVILGKSIKELNIKQTPIKHVAVKEAVFPFNRFPNVDVLLGPEMLSTGEVMGIDESFGMAFYKSQLAAGQIIPTSGTVFVSVKDNDKPKVLSYVKKLKSLGFNLIATQGTCKYLTDNNVECKQVHKVNEGRPNVVDEIKNDEINLVLNTPYGKDPLIDEIKIRRAAMKQSVSVITTIPGIAATVECIEAIQNNKLNVKNIQKFY